MSVPSSSSILQGKRVLITGGARGLGRAFVAAVAAAGALVVIADVLLDEGRRAAAEMSAQGLPVAFVPLDLADGASVEHAARAAEAHLGGLDGLVNNGAIATGIGGRSMEDMDPATWDRVMNVNVRGTWLMTRACSAALRRSSGHVVNIASDTALWGAPMLLPYVASKGAVIAMTRSLAGEMGTDGVTVNAIAPGLTLVEATEYVPEARHRLYVEGRAIQRAQLPADIIGPLIFLLSDAAAFVTGQLLPVNGGFVMQ